MGQSASERYSLLRAQLCERVRLPIELSDTEPFYPDAQIADTLSLLSLITHSLRDGREMPASLPLVERLATHSLHKHHHGVDGALKSDHQLSVNSAGTHIVGDTLIAIPQNAGSSRHGHLNWRTLQVSSTSAAHFTEFWHLFIRCVTGRTIGDLCHGQYRPPSYCVQD